MRTKLKSGLACLGMAAATLFVLAIILTGKTFAADLGGNCCSDLEERIAELEATTARKGNRKVTVTISGQISKAIVWYDIEDLNDWSVGDNSNSPSYLGVGGQARIGGSWKAGYVLELGIGGYESKVPGQLGGIGYGHIDGGTDGLYVRRSYLYIDGDVGKLSVGKLSQATDEILDANTSNASVVSTPLSLRPLTGPSIGEALDIFDGARTEAVRYDSPSFAGFRFSASVTPATFDSTFDTDGVVWDAAVRYANDFGQIRVAAAAGYRDGVVIPTDELLGAINVGATLGDVQVISGSASIMHMPTGFFVTGAAGQLDFSDWAAGAPELKGWSLQGGVEEKWGSLGRTTLFVEHGRWDLGGGTEPLYWGGGVVQAIDAAAMELYVNGRKYDFDGLLGITDATVVSGGARVRF